MFSYSDPSGTAVLKNNQALQSYQISLHQLYVSFARQADSAFTSLEAFAEATDPHLVRRSDVLWIAFPRTAAASEQEIDRDRFRWQDEYVEWRVERGDDGRILRITFTTEFPEYYQALAEQGTGALIRGIQEVIGGADPTIEDLYGPEFDPEHATAEGRARAFWDWRKRNPWNNGTDGILFLSQRFNTLGALFNLLGHCGIVQSDVPVDAVCDKVGGACGVGRSSDPRICAAAQNLARDDKSFSLADPAGIQIDRLTGIWKRAGQQIDLNDSASSGEIWKITRNGRRAVLEIPEDLTLGDDPITSGSQVAAQLNVFATVVFAPDTNLPAWARVGQESSRSIS